MSNYLGDFLAGVTLRFKWNTFALAGESITRATDGSIRVYKDDSATQRTSGAGITDTEDFDSLTGLHHITIDLSDNTDAGFYVAGHDYMVVLVGAVIDGKTINSVLAEFSIENRNTKADVTKWSGTTVAAPDTAGYPKTTVKAGTGTGEIDLSAGHVTLANGSLTAAKIAADAFTAAKFAADVTTEFQAGLATAADLTALQSDVDAIDANVGAANAGIANVDGDVAALQSDVDALAILVAAVKAVTDLLPSAGALTDLPVNLTKINGVAAAAARLALSTGVIIPGTVDTTAWAPTTTIFEADDITEATNDHYNGRIIIWTSGALLGQATSISDYTLTGSNGRFTVVAMTEAPANNDTFIII